MVSSKKIISGFIWNTIQTVINRLFGFIIKMLLARILFPEDYGLIGMAVVFTSFVQIFSDLGFGAVIVQRKEEILNQKYLSTAFWTGVIWSFLIFLIIVLIVSPLAVLFYKEEILRLLIPILSLGILINPVNLVHRAQLTRKMNFKKIALINNSSSIFAGLLALTLAYFGAGVWALAFNSIAQLVVAMPMLFLSTKWKPSWVWDKQAFKDLFGFGSYTTLSNFVSTFATNGDYLIIGKLLGKFELGLYSFAYILTDSIRVQVNSIINSVLYPVYSKMQDDKEKQFELYNRSVFFNTLLIAPIMAILFHNTDLVIVIFGQKWAGSEIIIKIIAVSVVVQIMTASFASLLRANDKSRLEFKIQIIKVFVFYLPLIYIGIITYGLVGSAIGVLVYRLAQNIINLIVMKRQLGLSSFSVLNSFFKGMVPSLLSLTICSVIFYFFRQGSSFYSIIELGSLVILILIFSIMLNKTTLISLYKTYLKQ